jgi:hypothetical protein
MLRRGVLLSQSRAVGTLDDLAQAPVIQTTDLKVPHETFVFQMAKLLYGESERYGPQRNGGPESPVDDVRRSVGQAAVPQPNDDFRRSLQQIDKTLRLPSGKESLRLPVRNSDSPGRHWYSKDRLVLQNQIC